MQWPPPLLLTASVGSLSGGRQKRPFLSADNVQPTRQNCAPLLSSFIISLSLNCPLIAFRVCRLGMSDPPWKIASRLITSSMTTCARDLFDIPVENHRPLILEKCTYHQVFRCVLRTVFSTCSP